MSGSFAQLCRAEWIKILGHRRACLLLLGIFPVTAFVVLTLLNLVALLDASFRGDPTIFGDWTSLMLMGWDIPSDPTGRVFLMALSAFTFAGEYQWNTWKNITPRAPRSSLVLAKFFVLSVLVIATFTVTSFILAIGGGFLSSLTENPFGPEITGSAIRAFLPDYLLAAGVTFLAFLVTAILAVLAAMYSRSILGGTLTGIVLIFVDPVLLLLPRFVAQTLDVPAIAHLSRLVPFYNIENLKSWATAGEATKFLGRIFGPVGLAPPADGVGFSIVVLACWVALGLAAVLVLFSRQDITT